PSTQTFELPSGAKSFVLNAEGEIWEQVRTPEGTQSQLLFKLSPQTVEHSPMLLGAFDFIGDGTEKVFVASVAFKRYGEENAPPFGYHYQIYHKGAEGYALLGEFELGGWAPQGGPNSSYIRFIKEPDPKQPGKVFLLIPGGATWSTYYLLRRDGKSADKVTEASRDQLVDLNHDGIYEVMFSSWHNSDERCPFGLTGGGYIEIFQWDGKTFSYRPRWPSGLAAIEDMAQLYDMGGGGRQQSCGA